METEAGIIGVGQEIEVSGKRYKIAPLTLRSLQAIQQEALRYFKREYLKTLADNLELSGLSSEQRNQLMLKKIEEVGRWNISQLPRVTAYGASHVPVTPELIEHLQLRFGQDPSIQHSEQACRNLLVSQLDSGEITAEKVIELCHVAPVRALIPYDMWWITGTLAGAIRLCWESLAMANPSVTLEEVERWPLQHLFDTARKIEQLTQPSPGNSGGSPSDAGLVNL
jgi:hypothetical protein